MATVEVGKSRINTEMTKDMHKPIVFSNIETHGAKKIYLDIDETAFHSAFYQMSDGSKKVILPRYWQTIDDEITDNINIVVFIRPEQRDKKPLKILFGDTDSANPDPGIPPTLEVTGVIEDWTNKSMNLTISSYSLVGVESIVLPSGTKIKYDNLQNVSTTATIDSNGTYKIIVYDRFGQSTEKTLNITTIDKDSPEIYKLTKEVLSDYEVSLSASASDTSSGVKKIRINGVDYMNPASPGTADCMDFTKEVIISKNGTYNISASDMVGNLATKQIIITEILTITRIKIDTYQSDYYYHICLKPKSSVRVEFDTTPVVTYDKLEFISSDEGVLKFVEGFDGPGFDDMLNTVEGIAPGKSTLTIRDPRTGIQDSVDAYCDLWYDNLEPTDTIIMRFDGLRQSEASEFENQHKGLIPGKYYDMKDIKEIIVHNTQVSLYNKRRLTFGSSQYRSNWPVLAVPETLDIAPSSWNEATTYDHSPRYTSGNGPLFPFYSVYMELIPSVWTKDQIGFRSSNTEVARVDEVIGSDNKYYGSDIILERVGESTITLYSRETGATLHTFVVKVQEKGYFGDTPHTNINDIYFSFGWYDDDVDKSKMKGWEQGTSFYDNKEIIYRLKDLKEIRIPQHKNLDYAPSNGTLWSHGVGFSSRTILSEYAVVKTTIPNNGILDMIEMVKPTVTGYTSLELNITHKGYYKDDPNDYSWAANSIDIDPEGDIEYTYKQNQWASDTMYPTDASLNDGDGFMVIKDNKTGIELHRIKVINQRSNIGGVTINALPISATVEVYYDGTWKKGNTHALPEGTYDYRVSNDKAIRTGKVVVGKSDINITIDARLKSVIGGYDSFVGMFEDDTCTTWNVYSSGFPYTPKFEDNKKYLQVDTNVDYGLALNADNSIYTRGSGTAISNLPAGLRAKRIACGTSFAVAILMDGGLSIWGEPSNISSWPNINMMTDYPKTKDIVDVAAGYNKAAVLHSNGTVTQWTQYELTLIEGKNVKRIELGYSNVLCLSTNGSLYVDSEYSHDVAPTGYDYVDIAAGANHFLALKSNGTLKCWGSSELSDGIINETPTEGDFKAVGSALQNAAAIKSDGTLVTWGAAKLIK